MKKLCFLIFILIFTTACFSAEGRIDGVSSKTKLTGTSGNQAEVDAEGQLHVVLEGKIDTNNSTEVALGAGESFTGEATNILSYHGIALMIYSDVASADDGVKVQFGNNGTDWHDGEMYTIVAGSTKFFTPPAQSAYMRVIYQNGSDAQGSFCICTVLKKSPIKWSSHNITDPIKSEDDAQLVKSVLTGINDLGIYNNAKIDSTGRLKVVAQPYTYSIAERTIPDHTSLLKFGTRTSVAANTSSTVWEGPTARYVYMTSAQQLKVSSTDADDNSAGTGARTLTLLGLDSNYDEITETIDLSGTSVETTALSYIRIYRAFVNTCGTSYTNEGTISILNNAGTATQAIINIDDSQTLMSMFTVPRGKRLYITNGNFSTDTNKGATVSFFTRVLDGGILYPWRIRYRAETFSGSYNFPFPSPFAIDEKTDVEVRVLTPGSAGTTSCAATFDGWYETED